MRRDVKKREGYSAKEHARKKGETESSSFSQSGGKKRASISQGKEKGIPKTFLYSIYKERGKERGFNL